MRDGPVARRGGGASRPPGADRRLGLGDAQPGTVRRCRAFAWEALVAWGWLPAFDEDGQAAADDVLLVVSELVANACLHTVGPTELALSRRPGGEVRIEVADPSSRRPVPRLTGRTGRPGGHGLRIVGVVAQHWGSLPTTAGKRVWAEIAAPGPRQPEPGGPARGQ
ncbi:ATP-binding protein [Kitasatospora sp. NBC_01250]|uniref:ATP-binding protein n=1 Tax=unclassified Kitasatospora TaxID=2633591 RepID=UPI002E0DCECD|nr:MULTISPECIES: ATP-binding protein [unclassified Kitasatospora]WSJ65239.1 ATP-binding protein [Kitasatospora sp. NBC_01302]